MQGQLTKKADVYSFGVLVIEIISSRSSSKTYWSGLGQSLLEWVSQSIIFQVLSTLYLFVNLYVISCFYSLD